MADSNANERYRTHFDPRQYLHQYYSLPHLAQDDAALFGVLTAWLRAGNRQFARALDFGCGPTLHNSFALAPWSAQIDLADYLPGNLAEIRLWLEERPDCHQWDSLLEGVLECEGTPRERLRERKSAYRSRVREVFPCDLRMDPPITKGDRRYDLVTSFFCAECVAGSVAEWEDFLGRIINLVAPGGDVFFALVRDCARYRVLGEWFASVPVTELDVQRVLMRHGFLSNAIETTVIDAPDWADAGFHQIVAVGARRRAPHERQR